MWLTSLAVGDSPAIPLGRGIVHLPPEARLLPAATGFVLFDLNSTTLPRAPLALEFVSTLDGRSYLAERSPQRPEAWTIKDQETGYLAASGHEQAGDFIRGAFRLPETPDLPRLFSHVVSFSVPATLRWLTDDPAAQEHMLASLLGLDKYAVALGRIDGVIKHALARRQQITLEARLLEGESSRLEDRRDQLRTAERTRCDLKARIEQLERELTTVSERRKLWSNARAELETVSHEIEERRQTLAATDAHVSHHRRMVDQLEQVESRLLGLEAAWQAFQDAAAEVNASSSTVTRRETLRAQLDAATSEVAAAQGSAAALEVQLTAIAEAGKSAEALEEAVTRQERLERQLSEAQERATRLGAANRSMQDLLTELKRTEVLANEIERQTQELERSRGEARRIQKLAPELGALEDRLREAIKQVDELDLLQGMVRWTSGQLQELRKAAAMTDQVAVRAASSGAAEERTALEHLREGIDQLLAGLDRQVQTWGRRIHELSSAPALANQLRVSLRKLQEELAAAYDADRRLATARALRQQRRHLDERLEELKRAITDVAQEQQECHDAPAQAANMRRELSALGDPRSQRRSLELTTKRRESAEAELRVARRRLQEQLDKQRELEQALAGMAHLEESIAEAESRREQYRAAYESYLAEKAVAEALAPARAELEVALDRQQQETNALAEAQAQAAKLAAAAAELDGLIDVETLQRELAVTKAQLAEAERQLEVLSTDVAGLEQSRSRLAARQQELEELQRAQDLLAFGRSMISQTGQAVTSRVRSGVAEHASLLLAQLLNGPSVQLSWPANAPPTLVRSGQLCSLEELSPTERACSALALRLALLRRVSNLRTAFIDGPASTDRRGRLDERLRRLTEFDQFFFSYDW